MLDGLTEFCTKALVEHDCPSVSIAVVRRDEVVLERAYGWADIEGRRAATTGTAYAVASISKSITATAVCAATDDGLFRAGRSGAGAGRRSVAHGPSVAAAPRRAGRLLRLPLRGHPAADPQRPLPGAVP
ncbi:serine hydrolase [Kitasatospora humi]|uniref:serine hydrolase n=1 Tax=Kitasatospora humi TaxID=2893891 RepID=UPI0024C0D879|nr:serine hydrolase domain-containing protein [Kitasatospora humi]